jgi:transposase
MKVRGRPKASLVVSDAERDELERLVRRARVNRSVGFRAKIVLACAEGIASTEVAGRCRTSNQTVCKWRKRFVEQRLDGLFDEPRVGGPRKISDADVEAIVVKTLETTPKGRTHWSTRKMAAQAGVSHTMVGHIWRTFGLQPHRTESFKQSPDPQLIDKVRDVVGLYMNPPERAVVFAVDEKSQIQALERAQPILPMDLGQPERRTHNYVRHGTLDLFAALNVATGKVIARCTRQHRSIDFVAFLRDIDASVEAGIDVHVVLDNLSAHKSPLVKRWLSRHPRFHLHFTPTYASWLNLVERFFGLLTESAVRTPASRSYAQRSSLTLTPITTRASPSNGPRPPTRSSTKCVASAHALTRSMHSETYSRNHRSRGLAEAVLAQQP